jgi:hypothetical protein
MSVPEEALMGFAQARVAGDARVVHHHRRQAVRGKVMLTKFQIRRLLLIAVVLFLASTLLNALLQRHMVGADTVTRLMGVLKGLILIVCANEVPKRLPPLSRLYCDPARDLVYRRIIGWLAVAAGLGFTLAYALAPLRIAPHVGVGLLMGLLLVVACMMAHAVWTRYSNRRSTS